MSFSHLKIQLDVRDNDYNEVLNLKSDQLPKLHEWTRVEISHVEEGGNYFLSLSVGGKVLGREECEIGRNLTDVKIHFGFDSVEVDDDWPSHSQPGFIRDLLVLES